MTDVIMPQMGESIAEGTITKWMKKVGDRVQRDEPLFEISTDKVDAEIPAPSSGVLKEIRVEPGATVPINTVVGVISEGDSAVPTAGASASASTPPPAAVPPGTAAPPPRAAQADGTPSASSDSSSRTQAPAPTPPTAPPPSAPASAPAAASAPSAPAPPAAPPPPQFGATPTAPLGMRPQPSAPPASAPPPAVAPAAAPTPPSAPPSAPAPTAAPERPRVEMTLDELRQTRSSPVVRKIAAEHNVDISQIPGTGISGRVTKQDILGHIETRPSGAPASPPAASPSSPARQAAPASAPSSSAPPPSAPPPAPVTTHPSGTFSVPPSAAAPVAPAAPSAPARPATPGPTPSAAPSAAPGPGSFVPAYQPGERIESVPMSPIRKKTAEHMVTSKRVSAHVTTVSEIDMSRAAHLRQKYRQAYEERSGVKLTYMPFIVKATIDALKAFPILNSSVDGASIVYKKDLNIGMAVALDGGLIVPVIRNADEKNVLGLARAINDLAERARTKRLKIDEVQGGTFTITNPGVFGSLFGTPIINQPQVGILGVGTIEKRPVVRDDAIAIRTMAYFALSFDHRIVDGADADRFMAHLKKGLQEFDESAL